MPKLHDYIGLALVAGVLWVAMSLFVALPITGFILLILWLV